MAPRVSGTKITIPEPMMIKKDQRPRSLEISDSDEEFALNWVFFV